MTETRAAPEPVDQKSKLDVDLRASRLAGLLGFHLSLAQVAVYREFIAATSALNLTPKLYTVLELIAENPGVSQVDIAAELAMDRATMMALVDRLERRTLIERSPSPIDRRRQNLHVTSIGEKFLQQAREAIATHEAALTNEWSPKEIALMVELLRRLQKSSIAA